MLVNEPVYRFHVRKSLVVAEFIRLFIPLVLQFYTDAAVVSENTDQQERVGDGSN